jgi:methionyl aminopeptidase
MIARESDIEGLKEAGRRFGVILEKVADAAKAGVTTGELDALSEKLILDGGDTPSFKGYSPDGASYPYPASCCISVNDEVVHGIPGDRVLKDGDVVKLDLGLTHEGYIMDSAITVAIGTVSKEIHALMDTTQAALEAGIAAARPGARIGDISHAIEQTYKGTKFSIVKVLGGHAVGREVHEEPFISNFGHPGTGEEIVAGMVLALEPIATLGKGAVYMEDDDYTYTTRDGSIAAHFEHTILVGEEETIVLTRRPSERF